MSRQADPRLIGAFLVGAVVLIIILVLVFGRGHFLSRAGKYVAYFEGSVSGLNVGAPVKLKGVTIGSVADVLLQYDMEHNRVLTPVILAIDFRKVMDIRERQRPAPPPTLPELIDRGLRARLAQLSLLTGQLFVDVNFHPDQPPRTAGYTESGLPEIPTIPSSRETIQNTIDETLSELRQLPIRETFAATLRSVRQIEDILADPETRASIGRLNRSLDELRELIRHVDDKVDRVTTSLDTTLGDGQALIRTLNSRIVPVLHATEQALNSATDTFAQARSTLSAMEALSGHDSELHRALRNLADAARSARVLADYLERHPEALIHGRRPEAAPR